MQPVEIEADLIRPLPGRLVDALHSALGFSSPDAFVRAAAYLAEDPVVTRERSELEASKRRVDAAKAALRDFQVKNPAFARSALFMACLPAAKRLLCEQSPFKVYSPRQCRSTTSKTSDQK